MKRFNVLAASFILAAATVISTASVAKAANSKTQTIQTEVTTKGTHWNGRRCSSTSGWTELTAPDGYVLVEKDSTTHYRSRAGSENRVDVEYRDWIEVVPGTGIKQPRTVRVRSFARSPRGKHGARGWTKAKVVVRMVKYTD